MNGKQNDSDEEKKIPRLRISHITKSFGGTHALKDVSFDLMPGEIHAVVGENGAGKSTLIKTITGLIQPDSGALILDGKSVMFANTRKAKQFGVSAVYQDPALFPHLTVAENMFTGLYPMKAGVLDREKMRSESQEVLNNLGFEIDARSRVGDLSVAEAEYVEIARALLSDLRLLILDEPTSALTNKESDQLYKAVRGVREKGTTVVWISHRMEEIRPLVDTVTIMRDGTHVRTSPIHEISDDEIISVMVGHSIHQSQAEKKTIRGDEALRLREVSSPNLFEHISLSVNHGEIVGLAGLVGAGRSELAQAIFGMVRPITGDIFVEGKKISHVRTSQLVNSGVIYCPEDRDSQGVVMRMGVADNICLPNMKQLSTFGFRSKAGEKKMAASQHDSLSIKADLNDILASLSGGNRQKVALARWLAREPQVLILDEPTHGIDIGTKTEIHELIRRLVAKGDAVLLISSDMPELLELSDRIYVMSRGRMIADFVTQETTQTQIMSAAMGKGGETDVD